MTTGQNLLNTALQTAGIVGSALASSDPKVATVLQLAPLVIQMLDSATKLTQAGALPPEQLASLFGSIGTGIQTTHDQWAAMNRADAAAGAQA